MSGAAPQARSADNELESLRRALRRRFGASAQIKNVTLPTLGGSNRTIVFDLVEGNARRRLVSRQESYPAEHSPFLRSNLQFRVMQVAFTHRVIVPEPIFEYEECDAMGQGYVTAFVDGETMPNRLLKAPEFAPARQVLVRQIGAALARLHSIDVGEVSFLESVPDSIDPLAAQLQYIDGYGEAHPALELGLRWLARNRPPRRPRRLLHGDFRVGNLMVGQEGLRVILDWECSHIGDPAEEFGWLCTRSWRFGLVERPVGGLGARQDLLDAYAAEGGERFDVDEVRYWEKLGLIRWAVYNIMQAYGHVYGGRRAVMWAACGRNVSMMEYDLLMTLAGRYD